MRVHARIDRLVVIVALALGALLAGVLAAPPPALAAGTQIVGMALGVGDATLVGGQVTTVSVTVHLTDPVGVQPAQGSYLDYAWACPCVVIASFDSLGRPYTASSQAIGMRLVPLSLASGTAQDGVWVGRAFLGAANGGYWRPTMIHAGDLRTPPTPPGEISSGVTFVPVPDAVKAATVVLVRGDDWPVFSVVIPAAITPYGQPFVVSGYALTSRTRRPVPGLRVVVAPNASGPLWDGTGIATRTSSTGRWAVSSTDYRRLWGLSWATDPQGFPVATAIAVRPHVRPVVSVRASASVVRTGGSIAVTGVVRPAIGLRVLLQRYYAGAWRTVGSTYCTAYTGTYRLTATPPRGTWSYRVRVVGTADLFGALGPVLTLRAI